MRKKTMMVFNIKMCLYSLLTEPCEVVEELKEQFPEITLSFVQKIQGEMIKKGRLRINKNHKLEKYSN